MRYSLITALLLLCQICFGQIVNSDDGYCYAKTMAPDKYDNVTEKVLIKEATNRSVKIPAVYETITEKKEVTPASKKLTYVPAVYETITEEVIDQPESVRIINIPAVFETVTDKILVKEESSRMAVVPAVFEMVTETIEIKPATKRYEYVPAVYETVSESVERSAPSKRFITIPAKYETVMEQIEIEPATVRIETIEPTYKIEEEKVLLKPSSTKWVETVGDKNCLSADPKDCIVWCMVEVPAEYKTVTRRVNVGCDGSGIANSGCTKEIQVPAKYGQKAVKKLVEPATSREELIPAEYATVAKRVLKTPATTREIEIPAEYITVSKQKVATPASTTSETIPAVYKDITKQRVVTPATTKEEIIPATYKIIAKRIIQTPARVDEEIIPAVFETITKKILVTPESVDIQEVPAEYTTVTKRVLLNKGDLAWQRIVCPRNQTSQMNKELQHALREKGYNVGAEDNIFGPRTYAAMVQYQKDNGLNSGHLDYETVAALGVDVLPDDMNINAGTAQFALQAPSNNSPTVAMSSKGGNVNGGGATGSSSSGSANNNDNSDKEENTDNTMSAEELDMIKEINLMRSNPKAYVSFVEEHLKNVENDAGLGAAYKAEELAAGRELINELKNMNPLPLIKPNEGLHKVAIGHGDYVRSVGQISHVGADGSYPWDRVRKGTNMSDGNENLVAGGDSVRESLMILLVDSGINGRGHRKTLFNPKWKHGGIYKIGNVGNIPNGWIQVFGSK